VLRGAPAPRQDARVDGQRKCDYTHIKDRIFPNIGENGKIEYNDEWKNVVESGWLLKVSFDGGFVFEKCR
jgi:hypothetical protein